VLSMISFAQVLLDRCDKVGEDGVVYNKLPLAEVLLDHCDKV
jgi:hypothetical protein